MGGPHRNIERGVCFCGKMRKVGKDIYLIKSKGQRVMYLETIIHPMFGLILFIVAYANSNFDTMHLPIYNGKIIKFGSDSTPFHERRVGICIAPTNDFDIRSCSYGKVHKIWKTKGFEGYAVMIASSDTFYTY